MFILPNLVFGVVYIDNALNVCFLHITLSSTHTLTFTIATFFLSHATNFHGVTFEMLPSCQDKSSTKSTQTSP